MNQPVAHTRFVYITGFWVRNFKMIVAAVFVDFVS